MQNLYSLSDTDDLLVSEITQGGSVFDVGTLFNVPGNDVARTYFRHVIYQKLADPKQWQALAQDERYSYLHEKKEFATLFGELQLHGVNTHHVGILDDQGQVHIDSFPPVPTNTTLIRKFHVVKPMQYSWLNQRFHDYSCYQHLDNFVIPLEYIVRFGITPNSSVFQRYNQLDSSTQKAYLMNLGVTKLVPWDTLPIPLIDCTSKYEPEDRALSHQEAAQVSTLDGAGFCRSLRLVVLASCLVDTIVSRTGLHVWDMKWELARCGNSLVIVDTLDTDSMRITMSVEIQGTLHHIHFSKQAMRDYYQIMHTSWYAAVNECKRRATKEGSRFIDLLVKGQQEGIYPQTPSVDPEFIAIQVQKMQLIQDAVCFGKDVDLKAFYKVACDEVDYYLHADKVT